MYAMARGCPFSNHYEVMMQGALQATRHAESYVLVTAAYNEGSLIGNTIRSVLSQEVPPERWVIVTDGSTDNTDSIVRHYAGDNKFIQLHRLTHDHPRNFAAQVDAINAGIAHLDHTDFDYIGNLDADITMDPAYFTQLLRKLRDDPKLGLAGGFVHERGLDGAFRSRRTNSRHSVAHAVQLFRRACFEDIGGQYLRLPYGGPDTYAEVTARVKGWRVESFPDLRVLHHRPTGTATGLLGSCFRQGQMDYSLGMLPSFEFLRLLKRAACKPFLLGSIVRCAGFLNGYCKHEQRAVPLEFMEYLRREQTKRLVDLWRFAF